MGLLLAIILVISSIFRFPLLDISPPELFGDEVDMGYQAYTLLNTGRDMYGQILPVYIHSLSEWLVPLWMYSTVPTIALFGLNEWGVRLPVAVFGSLGSIIISLLVYETTRNKWISALTGLMLAIMPWHIHYSRSAFGVVLMLDLGMIGALLFLKRKYILSAIFFGLCMYSYSTAWLFLPLLITSLIIYTRRKPTFFSFIIFSLVIAPLALVMFTGVATRRIGSISVASKKEIVDQIITDRNEAGDFLSRFLYNRPIRIIGEVADNYLKAFSPEFLFVRGDPIFRHNMQLGELFSILFPFVAIGIYSLAKNRQWLWLSWLVLSPIPSAITDGGGWHATRLFWMTVPLAVAAASGIWLLINHRYKFSKLMLLVCLIVGLFQIFYASYYYVKLYPARSWKWWHVGYKDAMGQLAQIADNYDYVYINDTYEPALIRFLFWTAYPPDRFLNEFVIDKHQANIVDGFDGFKLGDKYYFGDFRKYTYQPGILYVTSFRDEGAPPNNAKIVGESKSPYGEPILQLFEINEQ